MRQVTMIMTRPAIAHELVCEGGGALVKIGYANAVNEGCPTIVTSDWRRYPYGGYPHIYREASE